MRVYLGGSQAAVSQQLLHTADVCTGIEQMRGETVPQRMRTGARIKSGLGKILFHQPANAPRGQACAVAVEEQGGLMHGAWPSQVLSFRQPLLDGRDRLRSQ